MQAVLYFEEMRLPAELLSCLLVFLLPFAPRKPHFKRKAAVGYAIMVLISLLYFPIFLYKETPRFRMLTVFWYVLIMLLAMVYARAVFVISRCDALYFTVSALLSQNIVYCFYHSFIARVLWPQLRMYLPFYILGAALVTGLLCVLLHRLFAGSLREAQGVLLEDTLLTFSNLFVFCVLVMTVLFFYQGAFTYRVSVYDTMAWLSGVIVCAFILVIQYSVVRGVVQIREKSVLENMLRSSEKYYEMSKEHIAIINRKCHDLKHQLKALEKAKEEDRADYIHEAERSINFYQSLVYSDNEALNTILAEKGLFCQEKEITFRCSVDDVDLSFIRLPDLYAILGNAIDNAIEYVEKQSDPDMRAISMRIERRGMFIGIQVINPYKDAPLPSGELPRSSKEDTANHGFGMKSIRYLAEKYGGMMEYSAEGGLFTMQIMIPVK